MNKGLHKKVSTLVVFEKQPVDVVEVSEEVSRFESVVSAANFLGVKSDVLTTYLKAKTRIIKSKVNGKTYLIRKGKDA